MQICCTKKLYEKMKIKPEEGVNQDPFFSWHANLLKIRGLANLVVLTNDNSGYALVLTGLKQKHFKNLDQYILQALKETLKAESIKSAVVDQYLEQAGEIVFTKTKNRSLITRMNKACEEVYLLFDTININNIVQSETARRISRFLITKIKNHYIEPYQSFFKELKEKYGSGIFDRRLIEMLITLDLETEKITRKIAVNPNITFSKLHSVIQTVFGWQNQHLHSFSIYRPDTPEKEFKKSFGLPKEEYLPEVKFVSSIEELDDEDFTVKEKRIEAGERLSDYLPAKIRYIYDYGDYWVHYIEVIKTHDHYEGQVPACLEGKGNTPPENVGGVPGYREFIKIYKDKNHPKHEEYKTWAESLNYEEFDIQEVNKFIELIEKSFDV